jgi:hypothetical protein
MAITLIGHPSGTREVAFEREPRAVGLVVWVNVQHDPRDITLVGALLISIKQAHVRDHMLLVILREGWSGWRYVSDRHGRRCRDQARDTSEVRRSHRTGKHRARADASVARHPSLRRVRNRCRRAAIVRASAALARSIVYRMICNLLAAAVEDQNMVRCSPIGG